MTCYLLLYQKLIILILLSISSCVSVAAVLYVSHSHNPSCSTLEIYEHEWIKISQKKTQNLLDLIK